MNENLKKIGIKIALILGILLTLKIVTSLIFELFVPYHLFAHPDGTLDFISKKELFKTIAFISFVFILINKEKLSNLKIIKTNKKEILIFSFLSITAFIFYYVLRFLANKFMKIITIFNLLEIITLITMGFFLLTATFGSKNIKKITISLKRELIQAMSLGIITYFLILLVQKAWLIFSKIIAFCLDIILSIFYENTNIVPSIIKGGPILTSGGFTVQIGAPCSGIDSLLMFIGLYVIFFIIDKERINVKNYWILFPIGLIGVFLFNILRLFLLMLVGIHISPDIAAGLFHQNIGWIVFIVFFALFWTFAKDKIYKKE